MKLLGEQQPDTSYAWPELNQDEAHDEDMYDDDLPL
jgi:hypothetical protein